MPIYIDFETYNDVPINVGTYRYTASCEAMLAAYALDDGPVGVWDLTAGAPMPGDLEYALRDTDEPIVAHNAQFDRLVLRHALDVPVALERWRCTMARALAHSLPGGLDALSEILGLPQDQKKLKDGRRLVQLFCKPRPASSKIRRATRQTHPAEWAQFVEYARVDVVAMRELDRRLPVWNYRGEELALWHLDQRVNDRGVAIDLEFARAAIRAVEREQKRLAGEVRERTGGVVGSATQRDQLLAHVLEAYGVELPDLQAATLERRTADPDLPIELRELLGLRLEASTTSTSKYGALVRATSDDGRLRGTLQFCGAARTGRWAGRVFQPQNLPRPAHEYAEVEDFIRAAKADVVDLVEGDVMALAASSIRSTIVAPPGRKLVVCDLANIEGRMAAWLAGERWKLDAFRAYDAGTGPDLYKLAYARAFRIRPEEVSKSERQIGKVMELMLQYEGGVGAFLTGAATYRIDLDAMAETALPAVPADVREESEQFLAWYRKEKRPTFGLSERAFITCDALKRLWRRQHPGIVALWPELREACIAAVVSPGVRQPCGRFVVQVDGAWMRIRLPSGRVLCYPSPRADDGAVSYMGVHQYTRKWQRLKTYGGKLLENVTQAASRDVLAEGMREAETAGYQVVLTVHDEIVAEAPDTPAYTARDLAERMSIAPPWADGLPLAAAGFETYRYRKD